MIELTILEAAENIKKYQKEHQNWRFGIKKKEELGKPRKTS
jgi:hypothetical protein